MLSVALLLGLCLVTVGGVADFGIHEGTFQIIYHDVHNLLLTVHTTTDNEGHSISACYFAHVDPSFAELVAGANKDMIKRQVEQTINNQESNGRVRQTSLSEMRDLYQDLLADYHCTGKDIYTLTLDYLECTFDTGLCAWSQSYSDTMNLDWTQHRGATTTGFTGPPRDHTDPKVEGQYIYLEANDAREGEKADLESPQFTLDSPMCLRFWYFMYGNTIGSLEVYEVVGRTRTTLLLNITGDKGQAWRQAQISLQPNASTGDKIKIVIRAVRGGDIYGDIAIDDVSGTVGICQQARIDCDFERKSFCDWHLGETTVIDWKVNKGPTPTSDTGPQADHTHRTAAGYYLYMEGNDGRPQDEAVLVSPVLDLDQAMCMQFAYNMFGANIGQLALYIRNVITNEEEILWSRAANQGDMWHEAQQTIVPRPNAAPLQIIFRATRGDSIESDIAIDDIKGAPGTCVNIEGPILSG